MFKTLCGYTGLLVACLLVQFHAFADERAYERRISLAHTSNTRDLGGYTTAAGERVKWGMLYRSDSLGNLEQGDIDTLAQLNLATVVDFRSVSEREESEDRLPNQVPPIKYHAVNVNNPALDVKALGRKVLSGALDEAELEALLDRSAYIDDPRLREVWGAWLRSLAEPGSLPQLFHCTAGKDRTGFAAALLLMTLGVERDQVMEDFLLSNHYLANNIQSGLARIQESSSAPIDNELIAKVLGVSPASLDGAIAAMEARYGSVQGYVENGLGVDKATQLRLRALLLERTDHNSTATRPDQKLRRAEPET